MNEFNRVIERKIELLEEEKLRIQGKIELLIEVLESEDDEVSATKGRKNKPGRPKGSKGKKKVVENKHAPNDELYQEALAQMGEGTSAELQKKLVNRFNPSPRSAPRNSNITGGTKKEVDASRKTAESQGDSHITVDDEDMK